MVQAKTSNFNKEIFLLRLAITTECLLDCRYCFVQKSNGVMPFSTASTAIDLLLRSPGNNKLLIVYGGEPLLYFDLLKAIIVYSVNQARKLGKLLTISLGTNGLLLDYKKLEFLSQFNVKLSISMDGKKIDHDKERMFKNKEGSYLKLSRRLPLVRKLIKNENVCILFAVTPSSVVKMYDNFLHIVSMGFKSINIEPVINNKYYWTDCDENKFLNEIKRIIYFIYRNLNCSNFIFINTINRQLNGMRLTSLQRICPFYQCLEVYPNGDLAFSPFLINSNSRKRCLINGRINLITSKFLKCEFRITSLICKQCWKRYYKMSNFKNNAKNLIEIRNLISIWFAMHLVELSKGNAIVQKYIEEAKRRIFE